MDDKTYVAAQLQARFGIIVEDGEWADDGMGSDIAKLGRWFVVREDEERGLYEGDQGELSAQRVGGEEHGNVRLCVTFTPDDYDPFSGPEAVPFEDVEPVA